MNLFNRFVEWMGAAFVLVFVVGYLAIGVLEFFGYWDRKPKKQ